MSVSGFSQNDRKTAAIRASNQHEEDVDPARPWDEERIVMEIVEIVELSVLRG